MHFKLAQTTHRYKTRMPTFAIPIFNKKDGNVSRYTLDEELNEDLEEDKIIGTLFHEIVYADDTIIYSRKRETVDN